MSETTTQKSRHHCPRALVGPGRLGSTVFWPAYWVPSHHRGARRGWFSRLDFALASPRSPDVASTFIRSESIGGTLVPTHNQNVASPRLQPVSAATHSSLDGDRRTQDHNRASQMARTKQTARPQGVAGAPPAAKKRRTDGPVFDAAAAESGARWRRGTRRRWTS